MLTFEQLQERYPLEAGASPKSLLVEYVQCEILDSLYKQKESRFLSFMGGTALRIAYKGIRFSEDLDFDNFGLSFVMFEKLFQEVVRDMKVKGFSVEFRTVEKGAYHCYVKFPHILQAAKLEKDREEKILVRIDTMQKEKIFEPIPYTLNAFDLYHTILVNPLDILLSQKLIAIVSRKREKGRDFFDTSYLYGRTEPNFDYIEKTMEMKKEAFIQKLFDRCDRLDFSSLAKDVSPFLLDPTQSVRVSDFQKFIREKLGK